MGKVSIIMPVYNAEKYLRTAIDSVLQQTYTDFELILIDDRSADHSKQICMEYGKKDDRIVVLENTSEHHGPGPTRNIGLEYASGDYLYFVDSDDWIDSNLLECAVNRIQEAQADIVQFGSKHEKFDGDNTCHFCPDTAQIFSKEDIAQDFFKFWNNKNLCLWLHVFRFEKIKDLRFEHSFSGEDTSYVLDAMARSKKIATLPEIFYHYRLVEGSTCHRWIPEIMDYIGISWNHTKNYLDSFHGKLSASDYAEAAYSDYERALYQLCTKYCTLSLREKQRELAKLKKHMNFHQYRSCYPLHKQHGLMKLKYGLVKYQLEWVLLLLGPLFLRLVRGE